MIARGLLDERARLLTKPFPIEALAGTIREMLDVQRAPAGTDAGNASGYSV